jgi:hypothetical protein
MAKRDAVLRKLSFMNRLAVSVSAIKSTFDFFVLVRPYATR